MSKGDSIFKTSSKFFHSPNLFSFNSLADTYNHKGLKFLEKDDYENAITCFFQSLDYDQNYSHAYSNIGNALLKKGNYDEAVKMFGDAIIPELSDKTDLKKLISSCDLLIGGVLIPGAEAPKLVTKDMLKLMKRGSVIVDVAIDQGGCVETSKPTTHGDPTFIVDEVVHYCVANMPGGVPRTSTFALNQATLPYLVKLANNGYHKALSDDKNFLAGLNVCKGQVTYKAVAEAFGHEFIDPMKSL